MAVWPHAAHLAVVWWLCITFLGFPSVSEIPNTYQMKALKQELMVALKQEVKHSNTVALALLAGEKADL